MLHPAFERIEVAVAEQQNPSSSPGTPIGPKAPRTPRAAVQAVKIGDDSFVDRVLPHIKTIGVAFVVIALVLSGVFSVRWWHSRKAEKRTDLFVADVDVIKREVVTPEATPADPTKAAAKPADKDSKDKKPSFDSYKARAEAGLAALASNHTTDLAGPTYTAGLQLDAGKFDDAIASYQKASTLPGLDGVLAREGLGLAYEAKAKATTDATAKQDLLGKALAAFKSEQPDEHGPRHDFALYHEARIDALLGKRADAITAFQQVTLTVPDTVLKNTVEDRLAQLEAGS